MLIAQAYFTLTLPQYTANIIDFGIKNTDIGYINKTGEMMIIIIVLATILQSLYPIYQANFPQNMQTI